MTLAQATDTKLAELHEQKAAEVSRIMSKRSTLESAVRRIEGTASFQSRHIKYSNAEIDEILKENTDHYMYRQYAEAAYRTIEEAQARIAAINAEAAPLNETFEQHRWSRFFIVTSSANGHIHKDMYCSTCTDKTTYGWLPQLSGLTEADAVADQGTRLCSVCFPTAPVEWTVGIQKEEDPDKCPGSGTHDHDSSRVQYYSPRAKCNHCGRMASVTSTGKLRKHKVKA